MMMRSCRIMVFEVIPLHCLHCLPGPVNHGICMSIWTRSHYEQICIKDIRNISNCYSFVRMPHLEN